LDNCDFSAQLSEKSLRSALSFFPQFSHTLHETPIVSQCVDNSQYSGSVMTQCTARTGIKYRSFCDLYMQISKINQHNIVCDFNSNTV